MRVILAALFLSAGCNKPQPVDLPEAKLTNAGGSFKLNLMSFNVRYENREDEGLRAWRERIKGVIKMIHREGPDIIGVQESLHGQTADLWASLPDYEFNGVGRDDGAKVGEYSGIFYRRDRFQIDPQDCGTFWLSASPEKVGSKTWGNEFPRVAVWARLIDRATGRGLYVYNTHWDHRHQGSRERSALLIAQRIDTRKARNEPVVLIGDFNANETNPGLIYLTGNVTTIAGKSQKWGNGLKDTYQLLNPLEKNRRTLHFWKNSREGQLKVDHILVSRGAQLLKAEILSDDQPMISDHFPVIAEITFR